MRTIRPPRAEHQVFGPGLLIRSSTVERARDKFLPPASWRGGGVVHSAVEGESEMEEAARQPWL